MTAVDTVARRLLNGECSLEEFSAVFWREWYRDVLAEWRRGQRTNEGLPLVLAEWRRGHRTDEQARAAVAEYLGAVAR